MSALLLLLSVGLLLISLWVGQPGVDVDVKIPVSIALDPQVHRVSAPSFALESAEIQDVRVVRAVFEFSGNRYVAEHFSAEGLRFVPRFDLDLWVIVYGLIVLILAEVFRLGSRLDEEQSLTV